MNQFILLPPEGVLTERMTNPDSAAFMRDLWTRQTLGGVAVDGDIKVLDGIGEGGAKLVELDETQRLRLKAEHPGVRVVPVVLYRPALAPRPAIENPPAASRVIRKTATQVKVVSAEGGPVAGADVIAFTDFARKAGAEGKTDARGVVSLDLGRAAPAVERLYVYAQKGLWNVLLNAVKLTRGYTVSLTPIKLDYTDSLRFFYGMAPLTAGQGVRVGVIDTGISAEPDLRIEGGVNTAPGELPGDFGDNGMGHGTHVAGIIAGRGTAPTGIRGLAPGVFLRSYRVFAKGSETASNYAILKALDRAVNDGCDLVNMSLGGQGAVDAATHDAITYARSRGALVICAAGNDNRQPVGAPARDPLAVAVSAMGRKSAFPPNAAQAGDVEPPFGKDKQNFVAGFSNIGPDIDVIAPGVGIISTVPGGYAVMDGTSMACPAVTGAAARLLALNSSILNMPRNQQRSDMMARMVYAMTMQMGFGAKYEGQGMIKLA